MKLNKKQKNIAIAIVSIVMLIIVAKYLNLFAVGNEYFSSQYVSSEVAYSDSERIIMRLIPMQNEAGIVTMRDTISYTINNREAYSDSAIPKIRLTEVDSIQAGVYFSSQTTGEYKIIENYQTGSQYESPQASTFNVKCKLEWGGYRLIGSQSCSASNGCYCRYDNLGQIVECDNGRYGAKEAFVTCDVDGVITGCTSGNCALRLSPSNIETPIYKVGYSPPPICNAGEESCDGTVLSICVNNAWVSQGQVNGKCGYTSTMPVCATNQESCDGTVLSICANNAWVSQGQVNGKCGYTIVTPDNQNPTNDVVMILGLVLVGLALAGFLVYKILKRKRR